MTVQVYLEVADVPEPGQLVPRGAAKKGAQACRQVDRANGFHYVIRCTLLQIPDQLLLGVAAENDCGELAHVVHEGEQVPVAVAGGNIQHDGVRRPAEGHAEGGGRIVGTDGGLEPEGSKAKCQGVHFPSARPYDQNTVHRRLSPRS